jgi:hypothetical protein
MRRITALSLSAREADPIEVAPDEPDRRNPGDLASPDDSHATDITARTRAAWDSVPAQDSAPGHFA